MVGIALGSGGGGNAGSSLRAKTRLLLAVAVLVFAAGGYLLERLPALEDARDRLRGRAAFGGLPNDGSIGRVVADVAGRLGPAALFGTPPDQMPSSIVVPPRARRGRLPTLSIVADEDSLWDPEIGIIANATFTGPEWERLAWVSLWENGEVRFAGRAGLRVHGDSSRRQRPVSLRLYFRERFGASARWGADLLGGAAEPTRVVVVRVVRPAGLYASLFAFELGRQIGSLVPDFRPARLFLNGERRGAYILSERVTRDGWGRSYFGHDDFHMYVFKGELHRPSVEAYQELEQWVTQRPSLSLEEAETRIDVDNLTRHFLTVMFCFTTDWAQGAAVIDRSVADGHWFWVHWDMDLGFLRQGIVEIEPWEQPVLELVTLDAERDRLEALGIITDDRHFKWHSSDVRRQVFVRLLDDPAYRAYFLRTASEVLNHRLTPEFFAALLDRYRMLAGPDGMFGGFDMVSFLPRRRDFVRRELARYFATGDPVEVTIDGPARVSLSIDGYAEGSSYSGFYFPGQTVRVEVTGSERGRFSHWLVNGARQTGAVLELQPDQAVVVRPVLERARSSSVPDTLEY